MKLNIKIALLLCLSLVMCVGSVSADDVESSETPYNYSSNYSYEHNQSYFGDFIGPHHFLYGLKIGLENMDQAFTANASERLKKQSLAADRRLAEASAEMEKGNSKGAAIALEYYNKKIQNIETTVGGLGEGNPDVENAQQMMPGHQVQINNLIQLQTKNANESTALKIALNNSMKLEANFNQTDMSKKPDDGSSNTGNRESTGTNPGNSKK
ncbi:MAG: hypothetical protein C5S43_04355 [Candidatus Methanocomedens sp.]|nr:MAG: hypothetical protein C5S43_04355 [ANME-2 cluster archaeon]